MNQRMSERVSVVFHVPVCLVADHISMTLNQVAFIYCKKKRERERDELLHMVNSCKSNTGTHEIG